MTIDPPMLSATVIVPSHKGAHRLPALLDALARQDFEGTWSVLIALDGDSAESRSVIEQYETRMRIQIVASELPVGVCETLNRAFALADGDVLIRCDDDLTPGASMVRTHVELHMAAEIPLGVVGATRDVFAATAYARAYGQPANRAQLRAAYRRDEQHTWMHWAAHNSVTRDTWNRFGGFDERFVYGQDSELGLRLHESGVRIIIEPRLEIEHRGPAQNAATRVPRAFVSGASRRLFNEVHPDHRHATAPPSGMVDGAWFALVKRLGRDWTHPDDIRALGRRIDALPDALPAAARRKIIALAVEAAGYAGQAHGSTDLGRYKAQKQVELRSEAGGTRAGHALWVVPVADIGGVARHVADVASHGIPAWRMTVLCPEGPLASRLRAQGAAVISDAFGTEAGVLRSMRALRRTARALRPDVVHSHLAFADIITAWTPLPRGTRRFTTEHGISGKDDTYHRSVLQSRFMAAVHRVRCARFDGLIAVSRATRQAMLRTWRVTQPIRVIPNAVEVREEVRPSGASRQAAALRVLSLSRLAPEKRIDRLLHAFAIVVEKRPDATLVVAGEGPLRSELISLARTLGVSSSVQFPGFVDAEVAMSEADVIVQLSTWENCSYTLLDAVAHGIPAVASDVGGNAEIDGVSLVDAEATPRQIATELFDAIGRSSRTTRPGDIGQMVSGLADAYGTRTRA